MQETTNFNTFLGACNLNLISSEISILHIILINNKKHVQKKNQKDEENEAMIMQEKRHGICR